MTYWAALGQVADVGLGAEADSQRRAQLRTQNKGMRAGTRQTDQWEAEDEADLIGDLRGLTDERYASQNRLALELSGPGRTAAGDAARDSANADIAAALGMARTAPAGNRAAITGGGGGFEAWGGRADAQTQPMLDARHRLLTESRAQGGMSRFDRGALDEAANASIDIDRRAHEREQLSQLLAIQRQKMLAQLGIQYADKGPTQSQNNLRLLGGMAAAGGATADSAIAANQGGGGGYDWFNDTGGTQDGYTYDPYGPRFNTGG